MVNKALSSVCMKLPGTAILPCGYELTILASLRICRGSKWANCDLSTPHSLKSWAPEDGAVPRNCEAQQGRS